MYAVMRLIWSELVQNFLNWKKFLRGLGRMKRRIAVSVSQVVLPEGAVAKELIQNAIHNVTLPTDNALIVDKVIFANIVYLIRKLFFIAIIIIKS
jgi:hypothetical protein